MKRRAPVLPATVDGAPVELRRLRESDWPGPLMCDRDGRCCINGLGDHMDTCGRMSARRRWYAARRDYLEAGGVLS